VREAGLVLDISGGLESGVWLRELLLVDPVARFEVGEGGGEPGEVPEVWRYLAAMNELVVENATLVMALPRGELSLVSLWGGMGAGGQALERSFRAAGEVSGDLENLEFGAELWTEGSVSAEGRIEARLEVEQGRASGAVKAAGLTAGANLVARGRDLELRDLEAEAEAIGFRDVVGWSLDAGSLSLAASGAMRGGEVQASKLAAKASELRAASGQGPEIKLEFIDLRAESASADWLSDGYAVSGAEVVAGELFTARGALSFNTRDGLSAELGGRIRNAAALDKRAQAFLPPDYRDIDVRGTLEYSLRLEPAQDGRSVDASVSAQGLDLSLPRHGLDAGLDLDLAARGKWPGDLSLSGGIGASGDFSSGSLAVKNATVKAALSGSLSEPALQELGLSLPREGLLLDGEVLPLGAVEAASESLALKREILSAEPLKVELAGLPPFTGRLELPLARPAEARAKLRAKGLGISALADKAVAMGLPLKGLTDLSGTLEAELSVRPADGGRIVEVNLGFEEAGFSAAGGEVLVGALTGRAETALRTGPEGGFRLSADFGAGEALAGTVFLDLSQHPLSFDAQGGLDGKDVTDASGRFRAEGMGLLEFSGLSLSDFGAGPEYSGRLELKDADLGGLFRTFIQEPMSLARPGLAEASVNGAAKLSAGFSGRGREFGVHGRLSAPGVVARHPAAGFAVSGLEVDLPFAYAFGRRPAVSEGSPERGLISWQALELPTGKAGGARLEISLEPNLLRTYATLALPLPGGWVTVGDIACREPFSSDFELRTSADAGVDLSALQGLPFALKGELNGSFSEIRVDRETLTSEGEVEGTFFGGELRAKGFGVARPLSRGRVLGVEKIEIERLHLRPLSSSLGIGLITGRIDVDVEGYRQAFGQPVAFRFEALSEDVEDVDKKVSLKAVNSISVMGTGSGIGDVGVGLFSSFFETFSYDTIGVRCVLENDVFRVRGLIREAGVEYLIKKPLFFGINVINRNPDNRISFSDMLDRVRRVVEGGGPESGKPKEE
jgi:hypothetical protein